jgi:cytochrome c556
VKRTFVVLLLSLVFGASLTMSLAQPKRSRATREFMREKLALSQKLLEGLAIEDFDLLSTRAMKLSAMTQLETWRAIETPDYDLQSLQFRRHVDALAKAAKDRNLDAATLAYVRVTMSCVECHKFIRGKDSASLHIEATQPAQLASAVGTR